MPIEKFVEPILDQIGQIRDKVMRALQANVSDYFEVVPTEDDYIRHKGVGQEYDATLPHADFQAFEGGAQMVVLYGSRKH